MDFTVSSFLVFMKKPLGDFYGHLLFIHIIISCNVGVVALEMQKERLNAS